MLVVRAGRFSHTKTIGFVLVFGAVQPIRQLKTIGFVPVVRAGRFSSTKSIGFVLLVRASLTNPAAHEMNCFSPGHSGQFNRFSSAKLGAEGSVC
jgi:hypothetical protein